jgi:monoamine oxidase
MNTTDDRYALVVLIAGLAGFWAARELIPLAWGVVYAVFRRR